MATRANSIHSNRDDLWARFDVQHGPASQAQISSKHDKATPARSFRWVIDAVLPFTLSLIAGIAVLLPESLSGAGRASLLTFAIAVILWTTTRLNTTYIALTAVVVLVLTGASPQATLFGLLASDIIWLMIGAFILGAAVQHSGLALHLTDFLVTRARTVSDTFWLLTATLIPLAFIIPSTSGRAAVMLQVFRNIDASVDNRGVTRALALLIPTVILVSTICALVGAGSHLVANDLLAQIAEQRLSFTQWALYGLPFGMAACGASCWLIMRMFLSSEQRRLRVAMQNRKRRSISRAEWKTLAISSVMMTLWLTEGVHGIEIATVAVVGALILTLPGFGPLSWKVGLKSVSWDLIVFVGAALVLGRALIESGAAQWIMQNLFVLSGLETADSRLLILITLSFIALTSHIYMTSHTARAAALIPPFLYLAQSLQLDPVAVMFLTTVGMDYCLTLPISSKALLMFHGLEDQTFEPVDLLRLSSVLIPIHLGLILLFYFFYWPFVGLQL